MGYFYERASFDFTGSEAWHETSSASVQFCSDAGWSIATGTNFSSVRCSNATASRQPTRIGGTYSLSLSADDYGDLRNGKNYAVVTVNSNSNSFDRASSKPVHSIWEFDVGIESPLGRVLPTIPTVSGLRQEVSTVKGFGAHPKLGGLALLGAKNPKNHDF